jgi:hypothetical protein
MARRSRDNNASTLKGFAIEYGVPISEASAGKSDLAEKKDVRNPLLPGIVKQHLVRHPGPA